MNIEQTLYDTAVDFSRTAIPPGGAVRRLSTQTMIAILSA